MTIDASFSVAFAGGDPRLRAGVERMLKRLSHHTGLELANAISNDAATARLIIECKAAGNAIPALGDDESYTLEINERQARLTSATTVGALRGLETFLQLVESGREGYFVQGVSIEDHPRFAWRGLMIDVCRHWIPSEVLKRNIDGMSALKLNVLHWHLTEYQGFRIESKKYPKLQEMGSDGLFYKQEEAREIVRYAAERGIRVVPEFDMPGHATSWLVGYPELASAPGTYKIERHWGVFEPTLDPTREEVYEFIDNFIGEMAAIFPDAYLHIGGDEVVGKQWRENPRIQAFMKEKNLSDAHALQAYFNQRLSKILEKHGKKMIGWDETLHPDLPQTTVIQSWRGQKSLAEAAKKGYQGILSSGYYLDHLLTAERHYMVDPLSANNNLSAEESARILGGEACMWAEEVDAELIDNRIWTRLPAIAERFWSPPDVNDVADMYRRLAATSLRLEELGLTHKTYPEKALRRLACGEPSMQMETFIGALNPLGHNRRTDTNRTTQMTPLVRLVDSISPDQPAARRFKSLVESALDDAPRFNIHTEELRAAFESWRAVYPAMNATFEKSPLLRETEPLAKDLSDLGATGLEALRYLNEGSAPPAGWREAKLAQIEAAMKPRAELEIAVAPALKKLVVAAAEIEALKTMSPADWRKRINELAAPTVKK